jgi:hypothetical protein
VVHGPSGFAVIPRMCTQRLPISMGTVISTV